METDKTDKADKMDKAGLWHTKRRVSQKTEINAKCARDLRKERKVLVLNDLFFANFAKNLCVFALKEFLDKIRKRIPSAINPSNQ